MPVQVTYHAAMATGTQSLGEASFEHQFENQGARRRAQLVTVAAHLVTTGGAETVTYASVAELAGVHRTAVYKYFPTRENLLAAILVRLAERYPQRVTTEEAVTGVLALAKATPRRIPAATLLLLEKLWEEADWTREGLELRLAALILQRDRELCTRLEAEEPSLASVTRASWLDPLGELGLDDLQIQIVTDAIIASDYNICVAALAGSIDRDMAMKLNFRMSRAAVRAFVD
jgi:AcrR family transcriptional regulator